MRVVHVIAPGRTCAGAERVVVDGAAAQRALGVEASVLLLQTHLQTTETEKALALAGVPFVVVDARHRLPTLFFKLRRALCKADVLHSHGVEAATSGRLLRRETTTWVHHLHGFVGDTPRARARNELERKLASRADAVIAVSKGLHRLTEGAQAGRVLLPNGRTLRIDAAATLPPTRRRPQLLFLGRLSFEKGVDVLLSAVSDLPVDVVIAGDGPCRPALRTQADGMRNVTFVGHVVDVQPLLQRCDALVLPSRTEGLPLVVLEAQQMGRPVIATDVGDVREALLGAHHEVVPPADVAALRAAIRRWAISFRQRAQLACDGAVDARRQFSVRTWAERLNDVYRRATPQQHHQRGHRGASHGLARVWR